MRGHYDALCANDDELARFRDSVREFLVTDHADFDWHPAVDPWLGAWDPEFSARLGAAGFLGLTIPTKYGGHGLGHLHRYVVTEELLFHGAPVAAHWIADRQVAPALLAYGNEEQRRRLLPRIALGHLHAAIGMSEDNAGSDLAGVQCRATRIEGGWLLNGTKLWTSGAHRAHQIAVLARTSAADPTDRHAGFSQFLIPSGTAGLTVSPILQMSGEHHFNELTFDDVVVADNGVLGSIGNGWQQVTSELAFERSGPERILSTAPLITAMVGALSATATDAHTAAAVGHLLAQVISLRQLSVSVARALAGHRDAGIRAALVKDLGTRFEQQSVEICADLLAYVGSDSPVAPHLRRLLAAARLHAPVFTLRGGTNEVLRGVVARGMGLR